MMRMSTRFVITNLKGAVTPDPASPWAVDFLEDAAIAADCGRILWLGRRRDLPAD